MIKVFSGKWRGLGENQDGLGMLLDFKFREHLHEFRGARLPVFLDIALHSDENGFSFPGYACIEQETGLATSTISIALKELCQMEIDGHRVLLRYREHDQGGRFTGSNRYLVFPTAAELVVLGDPDQEADQDADAPHIENRDVALPPIDFPDVGFSRCGKIEDEVKPLIKVKPDSLKNAGGLVQNAGAYQALAGFEKSRTANDLADYPEDVRPVVALVCQLWNLKAPSKPTNSKRPGQWGLWVSEARELREACGDIGLPAIQAYYDAWRNMEPAKKYYPGRPGSLTYYVGAKAGEIRSAQQRKTGSQSVTWEDFVTQWHELFPSEDCTEQDYQAYLANGGGR